MVHETPPATRWNPLRTFQFRIGLLDPPGAPVGERTFLAEPGGAVSPGLAVVADGSADYVAGVQRVSGLSLTVGAHEVWEGGNALHRYANPDRATWDPITLEQGLAVNRTLELWAEAAVAFLRTGLPGDVPVKRNLVIDVWDPHLHEQSRSGDASGGGPQQVNRGDGGSRVRRYLVFNAWVSRYRAIPQLDAMANEVGLLEVELTHEGWRREEPSGLRRRQSTATPVPTPTTA